MAHRIGSKVTRKSRYGRMVYELTAMEAYTRKSDGSPTMLCTWQTVCPTCLMPFSVKTGQALDLDKVPARCSNCRLGKAKKRGAR